MACLFPWSFKSFSIIQKFWQFLEIWAIFWWISHVKNYFDLKKKIFTSSYSNQIISMQIFKIKWSIWYKTVIVPFHFIKGDQKPNDHDWCSLVALVCNLEREEAVWALPFLNYKRTKFWSLVTLFLVTLHEMTKALQFLKSNQLMSQAALSSETLRTWI